MSLDTIEQNALSLPPKARASLAQRLLASLEDESVDSNVDKLWLDEARSRAQAIDAGRVRLVAGAEVSRKARALIR